MLSIPQLLPITTNCSDNKDVSSKTKVNAGLRVTEQNSPSSLLLEQCLTHRKEPSTRSSEPEKVVAEVKEKASKVGESNESNVTKNLTLTIGTKRKHSSTEVSDADVKLSLNGDFLIKTSKLKPCF